LYPYQGKLIPIEVKPGAEGHLKSLHIFMDNSPLDFAIRFYSGELKITHSKSVNGKPYRLLNLPYFLATQIEQYIAWFLTTH
jgi:uncharacterized protein